MGNNNTIQIYTDGACIGNPGPGGWAAIVQYPNLPPVELCGGFSDTTNNRMEILAAIFALESLQGENCKVTLTTDSKYLKQAVEDWMKKWKHNGWITSNGTPVKNKDLWLRLDNAVKKHKVSFKWVKGHAGNPQNEHCDMLATAEAAKANLPKDEGYQP